MCMSRRLYSEFSWLFHELYGTLYDYARDFRCYDARLQTRRARSMLDLGCGTGLLARYLVNAGYAYVGADLSPEMLAIARRHVPDGSFLLCDMRDLAPVRAIGTSSFDAVLCTGRAFGHLMADAEVLACLRAVASLLRPGGIFCCDTIDAAKMPSDFQEHHHATTVANLHDIQREFHNTRLDGAGWMIQTDTHFVVREQGRVVEEFDDSVQYRAFSSEELAHFLRLVGLKVDFTCAPFPHLPSVLLASACKMASSP
jgi:SAM-dependent methyltransferase